MNKAHYIFRILLGLALLVAAGAKAQVAGPGGHYYKVVLEPGLLWEQARNKAAESTLNGVHGHLATITSAEEDSFIEDLRQQAAPGGYGSLWIGASQEPGTVFPGTGWFWVNGEGQLPSVNGQSVYANWHPGEPNDYGGINERYLSVGHFNTFGWNDEPDGTHVWGFVVEYDTRGSDAVVRVKATRPWAVEGHYPVSATFEFSRIGDMSLDLPVFYSIHGTASNGIDYDEISRSIIIPAGQGAVQLEIWPRSDMLTVVEPMETVGIRLEPTLVLNPTAGYRIDPESREAAVVIFENRPPPGGALEIAVPRRGTTYEHGTPVTILAALYYSNLVTKVDFYAGNIKIGSSAPLSRTNVNVMHYEGLQFYKFTWTNPPPGTHALAARALKTNDLQLVSSVVEIIVKETPATPVVSIHYMEPTTTEPWPDADFAPGYLEVRRTGNTNVDLQVFYSVGGTATAGEDYEPLQGYVVIGAGKLKARLPVVVKDDLIHEPTESVIVTLIPPSDASQNYAVNPEHKTAQLSIWDNDPDPTVPVVGIFANPTSIVESNSLGSNSVSKVMITRTGSFEFPLRVYLKYDGSATPGGDYAPNPATVVIPATRSSFEFELRALADNQAENPEAAIIAIAPGAVLNNPDPADHPYEIKPDHASTTIQIKDLNPQPVIVGIWKIREATVEPGPNIDPAPAVYALRRSGPTNNEVAVYLSYHGTATDGVDYPTQPRVIEIPAGKTERLVEIYAKDDLAAEGNETIVVGLVESPVTSPTRYVLDTNHLAVTLVIQDNDVNGQYPVVRVDAPDKSGTEFPPEVDAIDPARFVISRIGGDTTGNLQVFFSLHGTAINGEDYQRISNSVVIPAGQHSATIYIWPLADRQPVFHKYEIVMENGLSWEEARRRAAEMTYQGVSGHLATITSRNEDEQIEQLRLEAGAGALWVGGFQEPGEPSITEGWKWVNNEGPIPGNNNTDFGYANWLQGEPNDYWGPSSENHMVIGWLNSFGWNDHGANIGAQGFVVEFDIPTLVAPPLPESMETVGIRLEEPPYATLVPSYFINAEHYQTAAVIFEHNAPTSGVIEIAIPSAEEKYPAVAEIDFLAAAYHPNVEILLAQWEVDGELVGQSVLTQDDDAVVGGVFLHTFRWKTSAGRHTVRASSDVDVGDPFYSSTIPFFVEGEVQNLPPIAAIKQPADGAVFVEGDPIETYSEARDPDGNGIVKLELLLDGSAVASTNQNTLRAILRDLAVGPHTLHARATDGKGATGLSEPVRILVRHRDAVSFVHRELPETYSPGAAFTVELKADPPDGTHAYAVEDQRPLGWQVSEISHGGAWDPTNRKVKFGPFTDATTRLLTYRLTPPANATGRHEFTGNSSLNGALYPISGDDSIVLVQQYHPADVNQNFAIVLSEVTAYAAAWKAGDSWPIGPVPIPLSYVTRAGYIWKRGEAYRFDPSAGPAPACWVPTADGPRALSAQAGAGAQRSINGSTVTVTATPPAGASSYAIEERPPRGWAVSNVSNDGTFDAETGVIRWGVFFDATARTLTYTLTPPAGVSSVGTFNGQFSVDGRLAEIGSSESVTINGAAPIHITSCTRGDAGVTLNIAGPSGQTAVIEGSSDFKTWTELKSIFIPNGSVEFVDESTPDGHRFYRLRVQ